MAFKYELGKKHTEVKNNAKANISETNGSVSLMLERGYGVAPSSEAAYEDYLGLTVATEEISKTNPDTASILADQAVTRIALDKYGNENGKELAKSKDLICIICSEPGISSLNTISATIKKTENGYKLEGKKLISNEQINLDKFIVLAKDENEKIQLVSLTKENIEINVIEKNLAGSQVALNQVLLNTEISEDQLLGTVNDDFEEVMTIARTLIAAVATGIGHSALVNAIQVSKEVKTPEKGAISGTQSMQFALADMFTEVEAGRMLAYYSADTIDKVKPNVKYATMAKVQASDAAASVSVQSLQVLGNLGYLANNNFADIVMSAVNCQVKGGTNRVQKNQLYNYILAKK